MAVCWERFARNRRMNVSIFDDRREIVEIASKVLFSNREVI
jgi:hypothetical protein